MRPAGRLARLQRLVRRRSDHPSRDRQSPEHRIRQPFTLGCLPRSATLLIGAGLLLSGCTSPASTGSSTSSPPTSGAPEFRPSLSDTRIALINRFSNKLTVYDTTSATVVQEDERQQSFAYALPVEPPTNITVGSSHPARGNKFQIVRMTRTSLDPVVTLTGKGAFPLAANGGTTYYLLEPFDTQGRSTTPVEIGELKGTTLRVVARVNGSVSTGTVGEGRLWFTTYEEASNTYTLNSLALTDLGGRATVHRTGLRSDALTTFAGKVVVGGNYGPKASEVDCSLYCRLDDAAHRIYRLGNSSGGDLVVEVVDVRSGRRKTLVTGSIIDLARTDDGLTVYLDGAIRTFSEGDLA